MSEQEQQKAYCPKCKEIIMADAVVCKHCGEKFGGGIGRALASVASIVGLLLVILAGGPLVWALASDEKIGGGAMAIMGGLALLGLLLVIAAYKR
ncbi:MAG: zinc ribbon domain-containing protein [Polyangia bacterium]|jgi:hypothetical protein|nr:zinc ribbon domain-containing protein [Polyangia bacterium]